MQAIAITQTVYAATREENAVGAVVLARQGARDAFTAIQRVTHLPVNAPLLYLDANGRLSGPTKREMKRLHPDGVVQDRKTQDYVVGAVDPSVARKSSAISGTRSWSFGPLTRWSRPTCWIAGRRRTVHGVTMILESRAGRTGLGEGKREP